MEPAIQAAAQLVQVAALVVVLKVDPAIHAVQPVFAVVVQVAERRVPAAQIVQALHTRFIVVEQAVV